ncbi:MAG: hypothetical protein IJX18_00020 [Clostridia bacterium]|nr:hypothetical protein [Clostridia bacterium]
MNEEIEYAEMLEIPVSTVNVVKRRAKNKKHPALQQSLIRQVNERVPFSDEPLPAEESGDFSTRLIQDEPLPPRKSPTRFLKDAHAQERTPSKVGRIVYGVEFACACALCLGIFLTNVFLPGSAINTFFRSMTTTPATEDNRVFSDFTLSSVVGDRSAATVSVSPEGVVSFTAEGCVYPAVDGKVTDVVENTEGKYTVKLEHSPTFTSVIDGVDQVYYQIGEEVKHNVPVAFSDGETEVQVTMYEDGELLDCLQLDEQNCLVWLETEE